MMTLVEERMRPHVRGKTFLFETRFIPRCRFVRHRDPHHNPIHRDLAAARDLLTASKHAAALGKEYGPERAPQRYLQRRHVSSGPGREGRSSIVLFTEIEHAERDLDDGRGRRPPRVPPGSKHSGQGAHITRLYRRARMFVQSMTSFPKRKVVH